MHLRKLLAAVILASVCGCSIELDVPGLTLPDLGGEWFFRQRALFGPEDECHGSGRLVLAVAGGTVSGTAEPFGGCQAVPAGALSNVAVTDSTVSFSIGVCSHTGQFHGADQDSISGTFSCTNYPALLEPATWWAARVGAAGSLTLDLTAARTMVIGGTTTLTATLLDVDGRPLFGRNFAWTSSNPAVASVAATDNSAVVTGAGSGDATVSVSADGLSANTGFTIAAVDLVAVAAGAGHGCGIAADGAAWCWGDGGMLGDGTGRRTGTPVRVAFGTALAGIDAGAEGSCARTAAGALHCWGYVTTASGRSYHASPAAVGAGLSFATVSVGPDHSCGITTAGKAYCWGENVWGQLGIGTTSVVAGPDSVHGGLTFASISAGTNQTCGVTTGGAAYCWGIGNYGELGNGVADATRHSTPQPVIGGHSFASVSASHYFTCGLTTGGAALCWGRNIEGQLGSGATDIDSHHTPQPVVGGQAFMALEAGGQSVCAIASGGAAWCWGDNTLGQLGNGGAGLSASPVPVSGGLAFASLNLGGPACGLTTTGEAWCWGINDRGQVGNGAIGGPVTTPARVAGQP